MKKKENISLLKELHFLHRKCVLFLFLFLFTHSYIVVAQDNNATLVQSDTVCFSQGTYRFMGVDVPLSVFLGGRVPDKPLPLQIEYRDTSACEIRYYGLTILPSSPIVEYYDTICSGETYTWNGNTYTKPGSYTDTLQNIYGCDSITTLHLTTNHRDTAFFSQTACDSYEWHDVMYKESGTYYYNTQTALGCDSVEVLYLTLLSNRMTEMTDTMVGYLPYLWNGQEYTTAGTYYYQTQSIEGCDSIVVLHLLANPVDVQVNAGMEYCADLGVVEIALETAGFIDYLSLSYLPSASQYGLCDTIFLIPENGYISLPYTNMRAGIYDVQIGAYFRNECVVTRTLRLVFDYPTTIFEQQWNDLIAILTHDYNGGYDFTAFQWYRDGECLFGETHSYLHQPLDFGAEYTVLLTNEEGVQLMSCPFVAEDKSESSIYPTMLSSGEEIRCRSTIEAELYIYSSSGKLLRQLSIPQGTTMIAMPYPIGVYMFKFVSNNHIKQFKVIVS